MLLPVVRLQGGENVGEDARRCVGEPLAVRAAIVGEKLERTGAGGVWKELVADDGRRNFGTFAASSLRPSDARRAFDCAESEELDSRSS